MLLHMPDLSHAFPMCTPFKCDQYACPFFLLMGAKCPRAMVEIYLATLLTWPRSSIFALNYVSFD